MKCLFRIMVVGLLFSSIPCEDSTPTISATQLQEQQRRLAQQLLESYVFIGGGSGVLISADGVMVTNHHVSGEQPSWEVRLVDGKTYNAKLLGVDPVGDIAVLKLEGETPFPFVTLADEKHLRVGMVGIAVGNPWGLGKTDHKPTLTSGVVGGIRLVRGVYTDCLQVDAPVNPGNSGGPLFSTDGFLLGINGQIRTRSGLRVNTGIGLTIACTQLTDFIPLLEKADGGYVHHSNTPKGITFERKDDGTYIKEAPTGHLLVAGDKLIRIDRREVTSPHAAEGLFKARAYVPTLTLPVVIMRHNIQHQFDIVVDKLPIPGRPWHGLVLTSQSGKVLIRRIDGKSPADRIGLRSGMHISAAQDTPLTSRIDFLRATKDLGIGDHLMVEVTATNGDTENFTFRLGRR